FVATRASRPSACCNSVANSGASTWPENSQSGDTCASRISSAIGGPGSGGGAGELAKKTSGGRTTVYIGIETAGAELTSSSGGRSIGCFSLASASTLYSTLDSAAGFISAGCSAAREFAGDLFIGGGGIEIAVSGIGPGEGAVCPGSSAKHWQLPGVPATGRSFPAFRKNSPFWGTINFSSEN